MSVLHIDDMLIRNQQVTWSSLVAGSNHTGKWPRFLGSGHPRVGSSAAQGRRYGVDGRCVRIALAIACVNSLSSTKDQSTFW
jgi:hypothetical protein